MNIAFYTSSTGLIQSQKGLDVVANNVANVQTTGYIPLRASFSDLLYTVRQTGNEDLQTGHGSRVEKTDLMFSLSSMEMTDRALDFAIPDEGFFAVRDGETGEVSYTRNGQFSISQTGQNGEWKLVDSYGRFVQNSTGTDITVPMTQGGTADTAALLPLLGVYTFDNPYGLLANAQNSYTATASSGAATADTTMEKLSGALVRSGVDIADEMIRMMEVQRSLQLNAKLLQTADELANIANNLR